MPKIYNPIQCNLRIPGKIWRGPRTIKFENRLFRFICLFFIKYKNFPKDFKFLGIFYFLLKYSLCFFSYFLLCLRFKNKILFLATLSMTKRNGCKWLIVPNFLLNSCWIRSCRNWRTTWRLPIRWERSFHQKAFLSEFILIANLGLKILAIIIF